MTSFDFLLFLFSFLFCFPFFSFFFLFPLPLPFFASFFLLHLHLRQMEVFWPGIKAELQLQPTSQPQQYWILNPLSNARSQPHLQQKLLNNSLSFFLF